MPESERLGADQEVGYLRIPGLSGQEVIDAVDEELTGFLDSDTPIDQLILDLRSTNVGAPGVIVELLRHFVSGEVGAFHTRLGDQPIEVEPSALFAEYSRIPMAVLVDDASEAEAEQLAAILQDQGRATIIGQQTAGETHTTNSADLPDGSILQIVSVGFKLPDGSTLEGVGVTPDIEVDEDWLDFPEAEDPGILAAVDYLATAEPPVVVEASVLPGEASFLPGMSLSPDTSAAPEELPEVDASSAPDRTPTPMRTPTRCGRPEWMRAPSLTPARPPEDARARVR